MQDTLIELPEKLIMELSKRYPDTPQELAKIIEEKSLRLEYDTLLWIFEFDKKILGRLIVILLGYAAWGEYTTRLEKVSHRARDWYNTEVIKVVFWLFDMYPKLAEKPNDDAQAPTQS